MALVHHPDIELMAGDDWEIDGLVNDANGQPLNLTGASLNWGLVDPGGNFLDAVTLASTLRVTDIVNGLVSIALPNNITESLAPGRYYDCLKVYLGGTSTVWVGQILVDADPFNPPNPIPTI